MGEVYSPGEAEPRGEECYVAGYFSMDPGFVGAGKRVRSTIELLDHRGRDATGIAVTDGRRVVVKAEPGRGDEVFPFEPATDSVTNLGPGFAATAHGRWTTVKSGSKEGAQPHHNIFTDQDPFFTVTTVHNGEVTNAPQVAEDMGVDLYDFATDSAFINYVVGYFATKHQNLTAGTREAMERFEGAISLLVMNENTFVAARDRHGIRPLVMGRSQNGRDFGFGSEEPALDAMETTYDRDVEPGEIITLSHENGFATENFAEADLKRCMFEAIYFASKESKIEGIRLEDARRRKGARLADLHPVEADVVIGVPDSGTPAAEGYAEASGTPYKPGIKKVLDERSFTQPGQVRQEVTAASKYEIDIEIINGQRIVVVDDSLVNATTARLLTDRLLQAGAQEVHWRITSPPIKWPCFYGAAFKERGRLIAAKGPKEQAHLEMWLASQLGVDSIGYLSIEDTAQAIGIEVGKFCTACFTGDYERVYPVTFRQKPHQAA